MPWRFPVLPLFVNIVKNNNNDNSHSIVSRESNSIHAMSSQKHHFSVDGILFYLPFLVQEHLLQDPQLFRLNKW